MSIKASHVRASLVNDQGCTFDSAELPPSMVRHWATGRGGNYILYVWDGQKETLTKYINGRKVDKRVAE